jgi:hypothetical protein
MATSALLPEVQVIANYLQEAAMAMGHSEIRGHLSKALGSDAYVHDVNGDDKSGDVVYSKSKGKTKKAGYKIRAGEDGKPSAKVDEDNAVKVTPRTVFESSDSSRNSRKPLSSEDISRLNALKESGILTADQVTAALARGESATSTEGSRRTSRETPADSSLKSTWKPEGVLLVESNATFCEQPRLSEATSTHYPIKLMSPGRGSSGYYPPETLKKASSDNVFKAGTQMFWNHDTDAEESARPEGDLTRLAAVTTTDAKWQESGHDGPGLYATAKVFADYADRVKEMGKHIGLSIRAGGDRDEAAKGPDGKPRVITALRNAASVDFVTKAGRDGKIFTEKFKFAESETHEGDDMDEAQVKKLIKESLAPVEAENKALKEMLAATRAPALIGKHLADIRLPDAIKVKITEALAYSIPANADGSVDDAKLKIAVEAKAKEWADLLPALGFNVNPAAFGKPITEAERTATATAMDVDRDAVFEGLTDIFVGKAYNKGSVDPEKRSLRKVAREAFKEGRAA